MSRPPMMAEIMTEKHKDALKQHLPELTSNLRLTAPFWAFLIKYKVCVPSDRQEIENGKGADGDKVIELVTMLMKRPDQCYERFVEALRETDQEHLAVLLEVENSHKPQKNATMETHGDQQESCAREDTRTSILPDQTWLVVKNDVKNFLEECTVRWQPVNNDYCRKKYECLLDDPYDVVAEYQNTSGRLVHEKLVFEVAHSIGITYKEISNDMSFDWRYCRICMVLKHKVKQEPNADRWQQQLYQHQQSAERVTGYCQRVNQSVDSDKGELVLYLGLMPYAPHFEPPYETSVRIYDMKRGNQSYFMWEHIKAGSGTQELLSCLFCYLKRHLQEVHTHRLVLVTRPYEGLLRNTIFIGFGLWLMVHSHIKELCVIYQYQGHRIAIPEHPDSMQYVKARGAFQSQSAPPFKPLQDIIKDGGYRGITCMTSNMVFDMSALKGHLRCVNGEEIQVSLNTTRCLHMSRQESECRLKMEKYFNDNAGNTADDNRVAEYRLPLPSGKNELLPLYPSGYRIPVEYYNILLQYCHRWEDYYKSHAKVDMSDKRKVVPIQGYIIPETDDLDYDSDVNYGDDGVEDLIEL